MKKKILVYDSGVGYFRLLEQAINNGFEFTLYNGQHNICNFDAIMFFLHDKIEALDMGRLYDANTPFIVAAHNCRTSIRNDANVYGINLALPRDMIIKMLKTILKELQQVPA